MVALVPPRLKHVLAASAFAATLVSGCRRSVGGERASVGVFVPDRTSWFRLRLSERRVVSVPAEVRFDLPVAGDWDGDGWTELGGFDSSTGRLVLFAGTGDDAPRPIFDARFPERRGCRPVAGDFEGTGRAGIGLYDPAEGSFVLARSVDEPNVRTVRFGDAGRDQWPVAADFGGRGHAQLGLYEPATGEFLIQSGDPLAPDRRFRFGPGGGLPVAGAWRGGRRIGIGVYVAETGTFHLRETPTSGPPDSVIRFFASPARPVSGVWWSQSP